jgi:hypothetical protein
MKIFRYVCLTLQGMNKLLFFIIFLVAIASHCLAQTNSTAPAKPVTVPDTRPQLSIGGEFGFPTGEASSVYGTVLGGSIKLELPVAASEFSITFTTGYSIFLTKFNYPGVYTTSVFIPVEAGGKYYFSKIGYVEGDLGLSANVAGNYTATKDAFMFAPVVGFSALTSKHKATIDIGLRYEDRVQTGNSIGQIAIRVAYRFGLGKR